MNTRIVTGVSAVVLVGLALAIPRIADGVRADQGPGAASSSPRALQVEVVRLEPRLLEERLSTTGTVRANERVDLVSEISGVIERVHFSEGVAVERGQLLVKLEDAELQAQRDRVRYQLHLAEIRETRQRDLREQGVVSEQDYDLAGTELSVLRAELRLVEARLEKTEIRAPFAGVIGLRYVSEGAFISPQTIIATLQDLDPIKIDFTLPQKYAARVGPGTRVQFRVEGSPEAHAAEVYAVEPRIASETRSLVIRARSGNPDHRLLPGAFADVSLAVAEVADALVVPSLAIVPELGGKKVFVVEDGLAQPRQVETGIRTETEVQITRGLAPGERVIVSAIQRLRPGLPVEPVSP
jgi:membrane fusion protein (multidrug efflux system)